MSIDNPYKPNQTIVVSYNRYVILYQIILILFSLVGVASLIILTFREVSAVKIALGLGVLIYIIWLATKQDFHKLITIPFRSAFIIQDSGVWLTELKIFLKWEDFKEIVIFNFMNKKHFGFLIKDDAEIVKDDKTEEKIIKTLTWQVHKMIYACLYDAVSPSADEIIKLINYQYGIQVHDRTKSGLNY